MKQSCCIFVVFLMFVLPGFCAEENKLEDKFTTWITPSPMLQLYVEGEDDRKGVGRIFVPAMTIGANEPLYAVFKDEELIGQRNTGTSFFLEPGAYTVVFGTGNLDQRIHRQVEVKREETVIITPDWSALTIEVLDELRNYYMQDLHIYRLDNAESYGIIPAINPELGEQLRTKILKPGLYKIVPRGQDFNTWVNFTTVLLEPGAYTPLTIVINSETKGFSGAGILATSSQLQQKRDWKTYGVIHGSVILTGANDASSKEVKTNISLLSQLENKLLYDKFPHYYLLNSLVELGGQRQQGTDFQISQDKLRLKNTYVYYILGWLGGYARFETSTHLFAKSENFTDPKQVVLLDTKGNTSEIRPSANGVKLQSPFFPLDAKEGIGVNLTPLRTFIARVSLRTGLGYWQTFNRDVYTKVSTSDTMVVLQRVKDSFPQGLEMAVVSNLALLQNLSITTEMDVLLPFNASYKVAFDLENFITVSLSKNVTLEHTLRLKKDTEIGHIIQEQFISVRLSYFLY